MMARRERMMYLLIVAAFAGIGGVSAYIKAVRMRSHDLIDMLTIPDDQLNLGDLWRETTTLRDVTIRNDSNQSLTIEGFDASCGCVAIEPAQVTLLPRESIQITLTLDMRTQDRHRQLNNDQFDSHFGLALRPHVRELPVSFSAWQFTGVVHQPLILDGPLTFPANLVYRGPHASLDSSLTVAAPYEAFTLDTEFPYARVDLYPPDDRHPLVRQFRITIAEHMPPGTFSFEITASIKLINDTEQRRFPLFATGRVEPEIYAVPSAVAVEPSPVGTEFEQSIRLETRRGESFQIIGMQAESALQIVSDEGMPPIQSTEIRVKATVPQRGDATQSIRFDYRLASGATGFTVVPFHFFGTQ